jgi:hypothetical protein
MQILVSWIGDGATGVAPREQRRLAGTMFSIGRGTQCQIHLPDARVALVHARISLSEAGAALDASPHRVVHNDREVTGAQLAVGDVMEVGPYVLIVEPPPAGITLALSVRLSKRVSTKSSMALYRVLMKAPRLSKRRLSYVAFFGVLVLALLAPIATDLVDHAAPPQLTAALDAPTREALHALGLGLVQAWNPGPLARGHAMFGHECRSCHEMPFIRVRDHACLACHGAVREHVPRKGSLELVTMVLDESRCAGCHRDHKGRAMAPRAQQLCADCHGAVQHASMPRATDFAADHPKFDVPAVERTALKFNHTLHLDPAGVRGPGQGAGRKTLACDSCHRLESDGVRMAPISMEKHCSECHALAFDPQVTSRQVPHGSVAGVETMLREFYARLVLGDIPPGVAPPRDLPRLRPGAATSAEERRAALRIADERARLALRELLQTRAVCSTCHHVSRGAAGGWEVAEVNLTRQWMPASTFAHSKHGAQTCIGCHDVRASRRAEDVSMPDIARCRECHTGLGGAATAKVASDCAMCHRFHGGRGAWHPAPRGRS